MRVSRGFAIHFGATSDEDAAAECRRRPFKFRALPCVRVCVCVCVCLFRSGLRDLALCPVINSLTNDLHRCSCHCGCRKAFHVHAPSLRLAIRRSCITHFKPLPHGCSDPLTSTNPIISTEHVFAPLYRACANELETAYRAYQLRTLGETGTLSDTGGSEAAPDSGLTFDQELKAWEGLRMMMARTILSSPSECLVPALQCPRQSPFSLFLSAAPIQPRF